MADIIQLRRDTATNWTSANPVLAQGELGVETDTDKIKVGDGSTAWTSLGYLIDTGGYAQVASPTFTGTVTADGLSLGDNDKATFGASNDLQIFHNGTDSYIRDVGTGGLKIDSNGPDITLRVNATEFAIVANANNSVDLYYDNAQKLATTSTGIDVTGTATMDGLTVNGTVAATNLQETVYALTGTALDAGNGSIQTKTLAANTTFTDSLASGESIVLQLEAGASYTVTWPTMIWVTSGGNVAPTLTAKDTLVFWKVSSVLYGAYTGSYV